MYPLLKCIFLGLIDLFSSARQFYAIIPSQVKPAQNLQK